MSYQQPAPGFHYIRKSDQAQVEVVGCTGSEWNSNVLCRRYDGDSQRSWHVRLENFWKKYEETN